MASKDISLFIATKLKENAPQFFPSYATYRKPYFEARRTDLANKYLAEQDPLKRKEIEAEGKYVKQILDVLTLS